MSRTVATLLALALLLAAASAQAQDPLPMQQCERDARAIAAALDIDARRTRVWYWAWMATGTALLVGQATLAPLVHGDERVEFAAGAATSVFIPAILALHPPSVLGDALVLDARLNATTVDGRLGDSCIARERARELLARDAADEALATGWIAHSFVIGGNIAVGLLLGLAFHDWWGGGKQALGGSIVGELQILTLPVGALKARGLGLEGSF
ncbi:MAG TPA: hypothetical protein VGY54_13335 [Polyangiaceae bacterium]|jgi:hypothetical protein|nr:hypothetical protein [Polyangiaceae bacterium]